MKYLIDPLAITAILLIISLVAVKIQSKARSKFRHLLNLISVISASLAACLAVSSTFLSALDLRGIALDLYMSASFVLTTLSILCIVYTKDELTKGLKDD